ncbi:MAG: ABC transporter ATP-binding protein/permease [Caenispirillum sp.]|nr:ABC transporter ATP-binding protein/permease [Caenispirillum sp.]
MDAVAVGPAAPDAPQTPVKEPQRPVGFLRRFVRLAGGYWGGANRWHALALTGLVVALTVCQVVVPVAVNIWMQRLFDALEQKALGQFGGLIGALAVIILANVLITTAHLRAKRRLQVSWRAWLTKRVLEDWMQGGRHYLVTFLPGEHDNPDGRIAEDIRITTEYAVDLAHSLTYSGLLLVSFTQILWTLSGSPWVHIDGMELYIPGHLVWIALIYAAIGTSVALLLGRPLVRAVNRRQTYEANFRFGLVHARENALAISLLHGEADERRHFGGLWADLRRAWDRQTHALCTIFYFTTVWSVLSQAFPVLVAAPRYVAGTISLGILMQTAQAFQQMVGALSWPIDNLAKVAEWRASVERVQSLKDALDSLRDGTVLEGGGTARIVMEPTDEALLAFHGLTITNPDGRPVLCDLTAEIPRGDRVLISGDPGAAVKLFKVVAGMWPWGSGSVRLPPGGAIFFMPQRPYLPIGTLRAAVTYPGDPAMVVPGTVEAAMRRVGLGHLVARLDDAENWEQVLAASEQQRLGFARLLLHRPQWIFLQEATDALDARGEQEMMRLLLEEFPTGTLITIGHHKALDNYHRRKLALVVCDGVITVHDAELAPTVIYPAAQ